MMTFVERLAAEWGIADSTPDDAETGSAITAFQDRFGLALPPDVRSFYERFSGLLDIDSDLNRFWPIDEVDTVATAVDQYCGVPNFSGIAKHLPNADEYFAFADHSIWIFIYAVRLSKDHSISGPVVWIADGKTFDVMADTFSGFWERYLASPDRVLVP